LLGIDTQDDVQRIYVDTPGLHSKAHNRMNKIMNRDAASVLGEVDLVLWLLVADQWTEEDQLVLKRLQQQGSKVFVVVNQIDRYSEKSKMLPYLQKLGTLMDFSDFVPVSAMTKEGLPELQRLIDDHLPEMEAFLFPEDQSTDQSDNFMMSELIREKLFRLLGEELPYGLAVQIEHKKLEGKMLRVNAVIWVDKPSHKPMVIGHKGQMLKQVGTQAREEIQRWLGQKVHLELWVKVKSNWADNRLDLRSLGHED